MLIKLLIPRLLVTASVLLVVTVGVRAPRTIKGPRDFVKPDYSSPVEHKTTHEYEHPPTDTYDAHKTTHEYEHPPTDTYDREHIHPPNHPRDSNTYTDPGFIFWPPNLPQRPRNPGTHDYSPPVNNTRHDDNGKALLAIQQPKSHTDESLLNRMLIKIIGSLRTLANETIAVQELLKGDIPRKEESQNSSELTASEQPKSLEILTTTTTIDPMLVDELQDPKNPFNLGQGYGNLHLSKPVVYEDMSTWNFPGQTSRVP